MRCAGHREAIMREVLGTLNAWSDCLGLRPLFGREVVVAGGSPTSFSELLRQLRLGAGLTQEELAAAARLSSRSVSDLERGINRTARRDTARLLADALNLAGDERDAFELVAQGRAESASLVALLAAGGAAVMSSPVSRRQSAAAFVARYRRHVLEHHGLIEPPDFDRRRRVPVADLYVPPLIVQVADGDPLTGSRGTAAASGRTVDLQTLAEEIGRTVLLGDPGSGKTTAANVMMNYQASGQDQRVPFLVTMREFAAADPLERSVAGHIEHKLDSFYQCAPPAGLVVQLLSAGSAIVIFDGLDELIDPARRSEVTAAVERFCAEYPLTPVLVTSRVVGYDQARLDDTQFVRFLIDRFDEERVAAYVRNWFALEYLHDETEAQQSVRAFLEESAGITDLRSNPLMLALMCILYRGQGSLPRDRAGIYEQCSGLLFRKWDSRRRIQQSLRAGHLVEPALRHVAWWLFTRGQAQPAVSEREIVAHIADFLHGRGIEDFDESRQAAEELVGSCRGRMWVFSDCGTSALGEVLYSFTHRTFLEYFAAAHLAIESESPEQLARQLAPRVARHEWEVVGELAVQIKDRSSSRGADRIYEALLAERRRRSPAGRAGVLEFLARCLRSVSPAPATVRLVTAAILDHLFSGNPDDTERHRPLCALLACCSEQRAVVSDAISMRINGMVQSPDPDIQLGGLHLAIFLPFGEQRTDYGPGLPGSSQLARFWWRRTAEHLQAHAAMITAMAANDPEVRMGAIWWDVITVGQALGMPGGPDLLFTNPAGNFGGRWTSYLPQAAQELIIQGNRAGTSGYPITDLAAFGHYLAEAQHLPWVGELPDLRPYLRYDRWKQPDAADLTRVPVDPFAYLGAAAALCIAVESAEPGSPAIEDQPLRSSVIGDLYPYIARRQYANSLSEHADLPVPEPFNRIFYDWANRKINFTANNRQDPDPVAAQPSRTPSG